MKTMPCAVDSTRKIIVWRRTGRQWSATEYVDRVVPLAVGCELPVAAIYRDPIA